MLKKLSTIALSAAIVSSALAHDLIIYPHTHTVNKIDTYVAVDATSTHGVFRPDRAVSADGIAVYGVDGEKIDDLGAMFLGKTRTTFEMPITEAGTYKLELQRDPIYWSNYLIGERDTKKWMRNTNKTLARQNAPEDARELTTTRYVMSSLAFVTAKVPTDTVLAPKGEGLEIVPITHPGDYVTGEDIVIQVTFDGTPLSEIDVQLKDEQAFYRGEHEKRVTYTTNQNGELSFNFETGGRFIAAVRHTVDSSDPEADKEAYRLYYPFEVTFE